MTVTDTTVDSGTSPDQPHRTGRWIEHWDPEDPAFWAETGATVARRNLWSSIFSEHLGFSVWLLWSVSSALLANINFFYPAAKKGTALGLNAAGGNVGVAIIQFFLPIVVGGAGAFGLVKASKGGLHLERAGFLYAALAVVASVCAWRFMNNLVV